MSEPGPVLIVFQDLDGCLNPANGEELPSGAVAKLSPSQLETLGEYDRAVDESPVQHVVINTGRGLADTLYLLDHFRSPKIRYALLEHSALAYDHFEKSLIDLPHLARQCPWPDLADRYERLSSIDRVLDWYRREGIRHMAEKFQHHLPPFAKTANLSISVPPETGPEELLAALKKELQRALPEEFGFLKFCYTSRYVDVLCEIEKIDGARLMLDYLDIDARHAAAIGDGMNDFSMFLETDHLLCPANAHTLLKDLCRRRGGVISNHSFGAASIGYLRGLPPRRD